MLYIRRFYPYNYHHFALIYGRNLLAKIPRDNDLNSNSYGKRFKHIQTLINRFWKSWISPIILQNFVRGIKTFTK